MTATQSFFNFVKKNKKPFLVVPILLVSALLGYFTSNVGASSGGACSTSSYLTEEDCIADRSYCSNSAYTNQTDCLAASGTCSDSQYTTEESCLAAICGASAAYCTNTGFTDQAACEGAMCGGSAAYCSNSTYSDPSSCTGAQCTFSAYCSNNYYTDQNSCEYAVCGTNPAYCSGGGYPDQLSCEGAQCEITSGYCSDSNYTNESSCVGAMCGGTAAYCTGGSYGDQSSCENAQCGNGTYYCSGGGYSDESSCTSAQCDGGPYCSDGSYSNEYDCTNAGATWYPTNSVSCGYTWSENTSACGYSWVGATDPTSCGYSWTPGTMGSCNYSWIPSSPSYCGYTWNPESNGNCGYSWNDEVPPNSCNYTWYPAVEGSSCGNTWSTNTWTSVPGSTWSKITIGGLTPAQNVYQSEWAGALSVNWGNYDPDTCQYSYDNSSWTSVDCSAGGADIPISQSTGLSKTLYLQNTIYGIAQFDSINFNLLPDIAWSQSSSASGLIGPWESIATSRDGSKIITAYGGGRLQVSNDTGNTWALVGGLDSANWSTVSMSADGSIIAAAAGDIADPVIYISKDGGTTWDASNVGGDQKAWKEITMSADGSRILALATDGSLHTSANAGDTWVAVSTSEVPLTNWKSIAMSADGNYMYIVGTGTNIYVSGDFGDTWDSRATSADWLSIATSAIGNTTYAVSANGEVYRSTNYGADWSLVTTIASSSRYQIALSADATKIYIVSMQSPGFISSVNSGVTWFTSAVIPTSDISSIATSRNGTYLIAGTRGSPVYIGIAASSGVNPPLVTVNSPSEGSSSETIEPSVDWGTSEQCYYSVNGSTAFISTSCATGVVNISGQLSPGNHRISFYGYYNTLVSGDSIGFTILPTPSSSPLAPSLSSADTGRYNNDRLINYRTGIGFSGISVSNADIVLYNNTTEIGATTTDSSGNWTIQGLTLSEGVNSLTVTVQESGRAVSSASPSTQLVIDLSGPLVTDVNSTVSNTSATINWNTDESASGTVRYITGSNTASVSEALYATNHSLSLSSLAPDTSYSFDIVAVDTAGNSTTTGAYQFRTTKPETAPVQNTQTPSLAATAGGGGSSFFFNSNNSPAFPATTARFISNTGNAFNRSPAYGNNFGSDIGTSLSKLAFFILPAEQGTRSAEVEKLQKFLNRQGFVVAKAGPGSPGKETSLFGPATRRALARFQASVGIKPATGLFGPATKAYINKHYTSSDFVIDSN